MSAGRRFGSAGGLAIAMAWALVAGCVGCGNGLQVGALLSPGTGGSDPGTAGSSVLSGTGGAAALEIDGVPSNPVEVMTGASEALPIVTVRNAGMGTAHNVQISLRPLPTAFYLSDDRCSGQTLAPGQTCPLALTVVPEASGEQSVTLMAAAAEGATKAMVRAAAAGLVAVVEKPFVLAAPVGCPSSEATISVTNLGHQISGPLSVLFSAGLRDSVKDECMSSAGLPPGKQCFFSVRAVPRAMAAGSESVTISGSPGGAASAMLPTTGLADFNVEPRVVDLVSQDGTPVMRPVTLSAGTMPRDRIILSLSPTEASPFSFTTTCGNPTSGYSVGACGSCQVTVVFTPVGKATFKGNLSIFSGAQTSPAIVVSLTGTF